VNRVWVRLPEGKIYPFTWTNDNADADAGLDWTLNANWLGGIVAQPDATSTVRFFTEQTMSGGTVSILNNLGGQVFNRLELDGTASSANDTSVTIGGEGLSIQGVNPAIALEAMTSAHDLSYQLELPLALSTQTLISGDGNAGFHISGNISGSGGLTKDGNSSLTLSGDNSFDGGLLLRNGLLISTGIPNALGAGEVIIGGSGSLGATLLTTESLSNSLVIHAPDSGSVVIGANSADADINLSGAISLNGDVTLRTFENTDDEIIKASVTLSGGMTGTGNLLLDNTGHAANEFNINTASLNHEGGIALQGTATGHTTIGVDIGSNVTGITQNSATSMMILNGQNFYHGDTTVNAGTLRISQAVAPDNANTGNDASTVSIAETGATLDLAYQGTDKVQRLMIGSIALTDGVYGKLGSTEPIIGIPQITGDGTLTVQQSHVKFSSWIAGNFAQGTVEMGEPHDDDDNDGIPNLIEFALAGLDPTVSDSLPMTITNGVFSFAKRTDVAGITYAIEQSTDLGVSDPWSEVSGTSYVNGPDAISYAPVSGVADKTFIRLKITMDPQ
jgi:autotransporter-associated beta strand protein